MQSRTRRRKVWVASRRSSIVQLGPGTGGTPRALLRAARPAARLLAIELNPMFGMWPATP